ncbi:MAG TPA: hypothetical protein VIU61_18095 [Kofleriaceae bacterium]
MARQRTLPFRYYAGDHPDDVYRSTALTVFFAKAPGSAARAAIVRDLPPPLREVVWFVGSTLHVASTEFPDADVMIAYHRPAIAFARRLGLTMESPERYDLIVEKFDHEAPRAAWNAFFAHIERWTTHLAAARRVMFIYADAPPDREGWREQPPATDAALAKVIVPHLTKVFGEPEVRDERGEFLQNVGLDVGARAARSGVPTELIVGLAVAAVAARRETEPTWREDVLAEIAPHAELAPSRVAPPPKTFAELATAGDVAGFLVKAGKPFPDHAWWAIAGLDADSPNHRAFLLAVGPVAASQDRIDRSALSRLLTAAVAERDLELATSLLRHERELGDAGWLLGKLGHDATNAHAWDLAERLLVAGLAVHEPHEATASNLIYSLDLRMDFETVDPARVRRALELAAPHGERNPMVYGNAAFLYARLGDRRAAKAMVARAKKARYKGLAELMKDPDIADLFQ